MRLVLLLALVLATSTPAELASLAADPRDVRCPACGSNALRTLWQAARPFSHALPDLSAWAQPPHGQPIKEDSS